MIDFDGAPVPPPSAGSGWAHPPDTNYDGVPEFYLYRPTGYPTGRHFELLSSGLSYPSARTIATSMRYTDIEL